MINEVGLRLMHTEASPFARKVRAAAVWHGIELELQLAPVSPVKRLGDLGQSNPLSQFPVLMPPDGPIHDNRVIMRWLDQAGTGNSLFAAPDISTWRIQVIESLADGLMGMMVQLRYEDAFRPEHLRWPEWIAERFARIDSALAAMEVRTGELRHVHAGSLAFAVALEYLDLRHPDHAWRPHFPALAGWLSAFARSPTMRAIQFGGGT